MQTGRNSEDLDSIKEWIKVNGYEGAPPWIIKEMTGYDLRLIRMAQTELQSGADYIEKQRRDLAEGVERLARAQKWRIL